MKTNYLVIFLSKNCSINGDTQATFENQQDAEAYMNLLLTKIDSSITRAFYRDAIQLLEVEFYVTSEISDSISFSSLLSALPLLQFDLERIKDVLDNMVIEYLDDLLLGGKNLPKTSSQEENTSATPAFPPYWGVEATA
ncbi:hypothetical protein [Algoriphagus marincola]|uniref:hypothetical protein n=1 Tax=Algoriphagus marincola TaxID=264027 RepID=UPI00047DAFD0|nr:hypothetical protein [Algoriphagus marincola]